MLQIIQKRYASVLRAIPPSPNKLYETKVSYIITPASLPITAVSNNAFHPDYIPRKTKERLALHDLYSVLNNSKAMYKIIQDDYLEINQPINTLELEDLLDEQYKLIQKLKKKMNKK